MEKPWNVKFIQWQGPEGKEVNNIKIHFTVFQKPVL